MSDALDRLQDLIERLVPYELKRRENLKRVRLLYEQLGLAQRVECFEQLFEYKAINLSAISLQKESFGAIQEGKYLQILAIAKAEGKSKNISLAYFGRVERVKPQLRDMVVEFVVRYRFEKSFMTLEHYSGLIDNLSSKE